MVFPRRESIRNMISALLLIFLLSPSGVQGLCCPSGGVWSEWVGDLTSCYDYCGGVGTMARNRTCLSQANGCPCLGNTTDVATCDNSPCIYPRNFSCSPNKKLTSAGGRFQCLAANETGVDNTTLPAPPACSSCPPQGMWGEWKDAGACSDTCGACGKVNRTRTCLTVKYGCKCIGNTWELQNCARTPCAISVNHTTPCCSTSNLTTVNGTQQCMDIYLSTPITPTEGCLEPLGNWNDWSSWTTCSASCGLGGTRSRTRTCGSAPYGCPCTGNGTQTQPCGNNACAGSIPCQQGYQYQTYDGALICMPVIPIMLPTAGTFTPYTPMTGRVCNDTCGGYGRVQAYRFCLPGGASCGPTPTFYDLVPCNFSICPYPRSSCAPGWYMVINTEAQNFTCIPRPDNTTTTTLAPSK